MAQAASNHTPAYEIGQLKFTKLRGSFGDKAHDFFVVYDDEMDQLIVRFVQPVILASEYYITNDIAFLVRFHDQEVIGFAISHFQKRFLPQAEKLEKVWRENNLAHKYKSYSHEKYNPKQRPKPTRVSQQRIIRFATSQTIADAEAELMMA